MSEHLCYGCMSRTENEVCEKCGWSRDRNNEAHQLSVGTRLRDQYIVGRVLGQGGFGITYMGWDISLDIPIAIKEFYPNAMVTRDSSVGKEIHCITENIRHAYDLSKDRFLREAKALAKLRDIPEIVGVYSFFQENDTAYIIMEYVKGMELGRYIKSKGGKLDADETFRILRPVMEALHRVHQAGLVHRDISPDNIILHPTGGAKILDFGAVRSMEGGENKSTEAILKHGFAPIEQYQTRGNLGPWSDEYALCATVYYCLTGSIPEEATVRAVEGIDIEFDMPGLTLAQQAALKKGMSVRAKDRYPTVGELIHALFDVELSSLPRRKGRRQRKLSDSKKVEVGKKAEHTSSGSEHSGKSKKIAWIQILILVVLLTIAAVMLMPRGWKQRSGGYVYYQDGFRVKDNWLQLEGRWYHFDKNGYMQTGFLDIDGRKVYMGNDGALCTGWNDIDEKRYYMGNDGTIHTGWQKVEEKWYYFDGNGAMCTGYLEVDGKHYILGEDGTLRFDWAGWIDDGPGKRYFFEDGSMACGFVVISANTYYFGEEGVMHTGWQDIDGKRYYFDDAGRMNKGMKTLGEHTYYFNKDGSMHKGWFNKTFDKRYYFDENGHMVFGLTHIDGKNYYFDQEGLMRTGIIHIGGEKYYFSETGIAGNGWINYGGAVWLYADEGGKLVCNEWREIEGKKYWFDSNGKCDR